MRFALTCALALACSRAWAQDGATVSVLLGGGVTLGSETDADVNPLARVEVGAPIATWEKAPSLWVRVDLSALPGETVTFEDPRSFRSLEFSLALCQPLSDTLYLDLCGFGGFASRLPNDPSPRDRAVRWAAGGVRFGYFSRGWLSLGLGSDQRLDGSYHTAVTVDGGIRLYESESLNGIGVSLVGSAILGLEVRGSGTGARRDVLRVGVMMGR